MKRFCAPSARSIAAAIGILMIASGCAPAEQKINSSDLEPKVESTKIFAADGSVITTLTQEENREVVSIDKVPEKVQHAVVAIEDARFYTHKGVDLKAILRATYSNAKGGRIVEGGSTITQQLVRNALPVVGKQKTVERKIKEANYAFSVDKKFSKRKILELYLNTVYFGEGAYGIQTAAHSFFGKDVGDLTLAEGALLAGLIRSPVNYDPLTNPDLALKRRNLVLDRMFVNHFATAAEVSEAKAAELSIKPKADTSTYPAPFFVDYITREIQKSTEFKALGETEGQRGNRLFRGGLRIYTTLDMHAQAAAEEAVAKVLDHPNDPAASLVAIDPKDGRIKAMIGGHDYFATGENDPCTRIGAINADGSPKTCAKVNGALGQGGGGGGRQAGSSFKPFVLATALTKGKKLTDVYQASPCIDIPKADAGRTWHVCNYEEEGFGPTTIREGTYKSINTVYAQIVMDVGAKDSVETAERMGICETTRPLLSSTKNCSLQAVPSAVLGTNVVSPLDMASAFGTFPDLGTHVRPVSILHIDDARGKELWRYEEKKTDAINPGVAFVATQALQDVIIRGTASRSGQIGRPAFGKTGTAQEWRDAWFVGGAGTDLVAAVTVYWPDGEIEMKPSCTGRRTTYKIGTDASGAPLAIPPECRVTRIRVTGGSWPTQIWQLFMLKALEGVPASTFPVPQVELVSVQIDVKRGCLPNPYTPKTDIAIQQFIKGTEPTVMCTEPKGPVVATVPSVTGYPEEEAVKLLQEAGFTVAEVSEPSRLYPPGRVTRQSPDGGTEAAPGTKVTIYISTAIVKGTVPDVVNKTEAEAKKILSDAGYIARVVKRDGGCKPNDPNCIVRDQTPDAGQGADKGSEVLLYIGPSG